jgi:hypothetical protein
VLQRHFVLTREEDYGCGSAAITPLAIKLVIVLKIILSFLLLLLLSCLFWVLVFLTVFKDCLQVLRGLERWITGTCSSIRSLCIFLEEFHCQSQISESVYPELRSLGPLA